MGSLLVVTGPPGAGKSSVARILADTARRSVLLEGDAFFGFLARGAVEPWLPASNDQNTVVTEARHPPPAPFTARRSTCAHGPSALDYAILLPSVARR